MDEVELDRLADEVNRMVVRDNPGPTYPVVYDDLYGERWYE